MTITVDLNFPKEINKFWGRIGEHNATELIIIPTVQMQNSNDIASYCIAFETEDGVYHSRLYDKNDTVSVFLDSNLTKTENLGVQLEAYDSENSLLVKSPVVMGRFGTSVCGEHIEFTEREDIIADIVRTEARVTALEHDRDSIADTLENVNVIGEAVTELQSSSTTHQTKTISNTGKFTVNTVESALNECADRISELRTQNNSYDIAISNINSEINDLNSQINNVSGELVTLQPKDITPIEGMEATNVEEALRELSLKSPEETNLIVNGSFDETENGNIANWVCLSEPISAARYLVQGSSDNKHAVKLTNTNFMIEQNINTVLQPGIYMLSFKAKTNVTDGQAEIGIRGQPIIRTKAALPDSGDGTTIVETKRVRFLGGNEWTHYAVSFEVSKIYSDIRLYIGLASLNLLYVEDIYLIKCTKSQGHLSEAIETIRTLAESRQSTKLTNPTSAFYNADTVDGAIKEAAERITQINQTVSDWIENEYEDQYLDSETSSKLGGSETVKSALSYIADSILTLDSVIGSGVIE